MNLVLFSIHVVQSYNEVQGQARTYELEGIGQHHEHDWDSEGHCFAEQIVDDEAHESSSKHFSIADLEISFVPTKHCA